MARYTSSASRTVEPDGKGGSQWITKGDHNSIPDSWRIPATGFGYRYAFAVPAVGYLLAMLQSPLGRICFILAPALLLAAQCRAGGGKS